MMELISNINVTDYIYPEYTVAVIFLTELIRFLIAGIDQKIKPRYVTALLGLALGVIGIMYYGEIDIWKAVTSYSIAVTGYQLLWQPIKERFFKGLTQQQKQ